MAGTSMRWNAVGRWTRSCGRFCVGAFRARWHRRRQGTYDESSRDGALVPTRGSERRTPQHIAGGSDRQRLAADCRSIAGGRADPLFAGPAERNGGATRRGIHRQGREEDRQGSVFKEAAIRLNETRDEKEKLQRIVAESEGAERQLRELAQRCVQERERSAVAPDLVANPERLASQAACRSVEAEQAPLPQEEVLLIRQLGTEGEAAERRVEELVWKVDEAKQAPV
jgi:hypothetical protein